MSQSLRDGVIASWIIYNWHDVLAAQDHLQHLGPSPTDFASSFAFSGVRSVAAGAPGRVGAAPHHGHRR